MYGRGLGQRYRSAGLVWILGGDRPIETDQHRAVITAQAAGLREGDGGTHLITFHPMGGHSSAEWFHEAPWLDFNMRQNGHGVVFHERYSLIRSDYDRVPVKPVLDGEAVYEDHPIRFAADREGHSIAVDVRRALYWDLFGGGCGFTYGHHSVWQMWTTNREPVNHPLMPWTEALQQPGAHQMQYAKHLLLSRPYFARIPDDSVIVPHRVPTAVPGAGRYRFVATRDSEGSYAMVYVPVGRSFQVRMDVIRGAQVRAWWFDPRTGAAALIGEFPNVGHREFVPPALGEVLDWVLVLDDAARNFPPPGQVPQRRSTSTQSR